MTFVGSKTPVSILNEFLTATTGQLPSYDLIQSGFGHNPTFTYRVEAGDGLFADGSGPSKQLAKHNAAQQLLDFLQKEEASRKVLSQVYDTVSFPQENQLAFNAVGSLTDYCTTKNHPLAVYELASESGPPHAKEFKYKCSVSNVSEMGIARTKKQAKHQAAYAVLTKLKNLFGEEVNPVALMTEEKPKNSKNEDEINKKYFSACKTQRVPGADSSFVINHYRAYSRLVERSETLMRITLGDAWDSDPVDTLIAIADDLGIQPIMKSLSGSTAHVVYLAGLPVSPTLLRSGQSPQLAAKMAIEAMITFL